MSRLVRTLVRQRDRLAGGIERLAKRIERPYSESFVDDHQLFSKVQLAKRKTWRLTLKDTGEAERLSELKDIHAGRRAFIVGNGPSIKNQDLTKLAGEVTFATNWFANHPDYDEIRPDYYCISSHEVFGGWKTKTPQLNEQMRSAIVDKRWKSHHFFPIWARDSIIADPDFPQDKTNFLIFERPCATVLERGRMNWDLTANLDDGMTGIITFCLPLAYHMGIREVYLLGCDCDYGIKKADDPKAYFYDFSRHTTSTSKFETLNRVWGQGGDIFQIYDIVRRESEKRELKIRNATRGGLLESFERVDYEDLF